MSRSIPFMSREDCLDSIKEILPKDRLLTSGQRDFFLRYSRGMTDRPPRELISIEANPLELKSVIFKFHETSMSQSAGKPIFSLTSVGVDGKVISFNLTTTNVLIFSFERSHHFIVDAGQQKWITKDNRVVWNGHPNETPTYRSEPALCWVDGKVVLENTSKFNTEEMKFGLAILAESEKNLQYGYGTSLPINM